MRLVPKFASLAVIVSLAGCGNSPAGAGSSAAGTSSSSTGGVGGGTANGTGGGSGTGTGTGGAGTAGAATALTAACGNVAPDSGTTVQTKLPKLPELGNVRACVNVDAVRVTFDPLDNARDYRIYPLPADGDITVGSGGGAVIKNAIYRCAGAREALYMLPDQPSTNDNAAGGATILNGNVEGYTRAESDATLGYVYLTPGTGRVPVYVLGNGDKGIEEGTSCGRPIFYSTRPKTYTTDAKVRTDLIAKHARDDGIAFYVPDAASSNTRTVYEGTFGDADVLRWIAGPEGTARSGKGTALFQVLTTQATDTVPVMRVHVAPYCSKAHDELVATKARFDKVKNEGDVPFTELRWSGLTQPTTMVVEALDHRCPYQGHLSPVHVDATTNSNISYPAYLTLDDMRAASSTGEVFVNGQDDSTTLPKAIARSFVKVTPTDEPAMDFHATFPMSGQLDAFKDVPWTGHWASQHLVSSTYDLTSYASSQFVYGTMLGELWFDYSDVGADVNGKVRITPLKKATLSATNYLHVTTEVDLVSTQRRYPQLLISDQAPPIQETLESGTTLIIQPKDMSPTFMQVQVCDHRTWDVNNQCPMLPTFSSDFKPPVPLPGELTGTDNTVKLDAYVSTTRVYILVNDLPYSCTSLPAKADDGNTYHAPSGSVSVTWGDVLYHSGVDFSQGGGAISGNTYLFHRNHMQVLMRRHFDNIGFQSGQPAPAWDENLLPCVSGM